MTTQNSSPLATVAVSSTFYHVISRLLVAADAPHSRRVALNKAVSAGHATLTTVLALYAVISSSQKGRRHVSGAVSPTKNNSRWLDDSENPLIQDRDDLSNALTAWEAGYLIYDTLALVSLESGSGSRGLGSAIKTALRRSPVFMGHHILLASGLLYLQTYIALQKDKGIRIIAAFVLMNASTPLLHARWWARKVGRPSRALDWTFAMVFAISRFGPLYWVMREYGKYHGMGPVEVWKWLRRPCQGGMLGLFGLNATWWLFLVKGLVMRSHRTSRTG